MDTNTNKAAWSLQKKIILMLTVLILVCLMGYEKLVAPIENYPAIITLVTTLLASVLLICVAIPLPITAMCIPVVLYLNGVLSVSAAFSGFSNENVILFGAMFIIGGALFRTGAAENIGLHVVRGARGNKRKLVAYLMITVAAISSVMSNTGTVAVLMPVCIGIADQAQWDRKDLLMPLALMSSIGGMISLAGTPPNLTVNSVAQEFGYASFAFFEYAWIGIPFSIVGVVYFTLLCGGGQNNIYTAREYKQNIRFTSTQLLSIAILLCVVCVMASGIINLAVASVMGALACILTGLVTGKEAIEDIDWTTIFLFAGVLPLANALESTGAGKMIVDNAANLLGDRPSEWLILTFVFVITAGLTQIMSNTGCCALLAPVSIELARALNANPKGILIVTAVAASSAFITPMATPPNTLILGKANAQFSDYLKMGTPMLIVAYLLCILVVPAVWPFF